MSTNKSFRIYGAGGFGVNIAKTFEPKSADAIAAPLVSYVDTSRSNLGGTNEKLAYLISDVDGSGKKRDLNAQTIRRHISPVLSEHPPGDFNLVLFSGSGGSGSVFGPMLIDELVSRKKMVIGIVLGDSDSAIATRNTLKTIQSLSALSEKHGVPITIVYEEMGSGSQRRQVDDMFGEAIKALQTLTSGMNLEMDTQDLVNWLYYQNATDHKPGLGILNFYNNNERLGELYDALTVASLYSSTDEPHGPVKSAYRTTGYTGNAGNSPMHYVITQSGLHAIAEALQRKVTDHEAHAEGLSKNHVKLHSTGTNDDFMQF
jgi:hypothetical protein